MLLVQIIFSVHPGTFNPKLGQASCTVCEIGKLSSADRAYCANCEAGEYSFRGAECKPCSAGKYAPSAQKGDCHFCEAGFKTNKFSAATLCSACDPGRFSRGGAIIECDACVPGKFSASAAAACSNCTVGFFAPASAAPSCTACAAGTFAPEEAARACIPCPPGWHQPASRQVKCEPCEPNFFTNESGALYCSSCATEYSSAVGASQCNLAAVGYYLTGESNFKVAAPCPSNANCAGGNQAPAPEKGFWSHRKAYEYTDTVYRCYRDTCTGANSNSSCWSAARFFHEENGDEHHASDEEGDDDDEDGENPCTASAVLCSEGAAGPLCGTCQENYIYRSETKRCHTCEAVHTNTLIICGMAAAITLVVVAVYMGWIRVPYCGEHSVAVAFFKSIDTGALKVLWVTYQIVISCTWSLDIHYPEPFSQLLGLLSFFTLDFLAVECFQDADVAERYFTTVYLYSAIPCLLALVIILIGSVRVALLEALPLIAIPHGSRRKARAQIVNRHVWLLLLLSYMTLPPVAMKQFQSFDCIPFDHDGSSYLRVDTAIDCKSPAYRRFRAVCVCFVVLYQCVPLAWMVLLWRHRIGLRTALYVRDRNDDLAPLRFLFHDLRIDKWWFEIGDMVRKQLLILGN